MQFLISWVDYPLLPFLPYSLPAHFLRMSKLNTCRQNSGNHLLLVEHLGGYFSESSDFKKNFWISITFLYPLSLYFAPEKHPAQGINNYIMFMLIFLMHRLLSNACQRFKQLYEYLRRPDGFVDGRGECRESS